MRINVQIDTRNLRLRIPRERKRLAFNTAKALNETAKEIQTAERINIERKFTVRKFGFIHRLVKIFQFASARQGRPFAEIGIDNRKRRVLLGIFERGGEKPPAKGKSVAVPITGEAARPSFQQPVQEAFRFTRLRLRRRRGGEGFVGRPGSGIFTTAKGVFQRAAETVRAVYLFIPRPQLDKRLDFVTVARRTFAREFAQQFRKAYRKP